MLSSFGNVGEFKEGGWKSVDSSKFCVKKMEDTVRLKLKVKRLVAEIKS
jgi:hypothetical protein